MIFSDSFYQIHSGEIFVASKCMSHEHALANFLHSVLDQQGYICQTDSKRIWKKHTHQVIVVLTDDFGVVRDNFELVPADWFDSNTTVITDNYMPHQTNYQICKLPNSYYGVFDYSPANQNFDPQHRFNLCINRMDHQRIVILLEALTQCKDMMSQDLVNFNGRNPSNSNETSKELQLNFEKYFDQLDPTLQQLYFSLIEIKNNLPLRNHSISIEQAHVSAYVNLVVETYAGNASIAFSEKIFRALVTPAPWTVFSAQGAVGYLKNLGFDVLDDLVDHSYDTVVQEWPHGVNKIKCWVESSLNTYNLLKNIPLDQLQARCLQAAAHNQNLLTIFRAQWPVDFADWLKSTIKFLQ
jgi:hypothetical protein